MSESEAVKRQPEQHPVGGCALEHVGGCVSAPEFEKNAVEPEDEHQYINGRCCK